MTTQLAAAATGTLHPFTTPKRATLTTAQFTSLTDGQFALLRKPWLTSGGSLPV